MTRTASQDALQTVYSLRREVLIFYHVVFMLVVFHRIKKAAKKKQQPRRSVKIQFKFNVNCCLSVE